MGRSRQLGHVPTRDVATDGTSGGRWGDCLGFVVGEADDDQVWD